MKTIAFLAIFLPILMTSQIDTMYQGNRRNIYRMIVSPVYQDTVYDLIKSDRMYFDPWIPAFDALFFADWGGAFFILPSLELQKDKWYHLGAGIIIGAGSNLLAYKLTKKKWLSFGVGIVAPLIIGAGKELIDPYIGHVRNWEDFMWTGIGGLNGSLTITIPIGHLELARKKHREFKHLN